MDDPMFKEEKDALKPFNIHIPNVIEKAHKILKDIYYGGQGYVLLVSDNGRKYILKLQLYNREGTPVFHEAYVGYYGTNRLNSPNFAKILGVQTEAPCPISSDFRYNKGDYCNFVIYEYIEGPTLFDSLDKLDLRSLKRIFKELLQALAYAYKSVGFIHFDLHPLNIILRKGRPVMIDYGRSQINCDYYWYHYREEMESEINAWSYDISGLIESFREGIMYPENFRQQPINYDNMTPEIFEGPLPEIKFLTVGILQDRSDEIENREEEIRNSLSSDLNQFIDILDKLGQQLTISIKHNSHDEFLSYADKLLS